MTCKNGFDFAHDGVCENLWRKRCGEVRFGWQPKPTGWQPVLPRISEFVFIRVDSWLKCAKEIVWSSLVDAFAAGHDTC